MAEIPLLLTAVYYHGRTANFAAQHGYLKLHRLDGVPHKWAFLIMAVGALLCLIYAAYMMVLICFMLNLDDPRDGERGGRLGTLFLASVPALGLCWIVAWLFFGGVHQFSRRFVSP